jgi:hypothetical protein
MPAPRYLAIYLNDHLAGSMAIIELVKRSAAENEGTELGVFLTGLAHEIDADRQALKEIMASLGIGIDRLKLAAGWAAEKAARLKLNGELRGYSPLSPLIELEAISLGIEGKRLLWLALSELPGAAPVPPSTLGELIERAERQRAEVERFRVVAGLSPRARG